MATYSIAQARTRDTDLSLKKTSGPKGRGYIGPLRLVRVTGACRCSQVPDTLRAEFRIVKKSFPDLINFFLTHF